MLLLSRRVILEELANSLVQVLHIFFLVTSRFEGLGCGLGPDKPLSFRVVHIQYQSPKIECRASSSCHPIPRQCTVNAIFLPWLLLINSDLISDVNVSCIIVGSCQSF